MEYEKFLTSKFDSEFKDKQGLYLLSVPDDGHTVQSQNRQLGGAHSVNLKTGSRLLKVGIGGVNRGRLAGRLGDYYSHHPNGFKVHALFTKQSEKDTLSLNPTKSRLAKAETKVLDYLKSKGLVYYKPGRVQPVKTEWVGSTIGELKEIMLRLHKSSSDASGSVWFFSRDDAELMSTVNIGQKLSERVAADIGKPKPKPKPTPRSKNAMSTRSSSGVSTRNSTVVVP